MLLAFSDYGGTHKGAKYDISSFLFTTPAALTDFNIQRGQVRGAHLGERRMSYKNLGDRVRLEGLGGFLKASDSLQGLLVSFAVDKRALHRLTEPAPLTRETGAAFREWAPVAFEKLTRVGHLAAICVEGVRADNQDLMWITDQDDIAPNDARHAQATAALGHLLSAYCTGPMGRFRFGTTKSDSGDLLIEDLAAVPDLAAGCLNDVLTTLHPHPASSSVARLFVPAGSEERPRAAPLRTWLAGSHTALAKTAIVVDDGGQDGCSVRCLTLVSDIDDL